MYSTTEKPAQFSFYILPLVKIYKRDVLEKSLDFITHSPSDILKEMSFAVPKKGSIIISCPAFCGKKANLLDQVDLDSARLT